MRNRGRNRQMAVLVPALAAAAVALSACGGADDDAKKDTAASASTNAASAATGGIAKATELAKRFEAPQPLEIAAMTGKPGAGKSVAYVTCNTPTCEGGDLTAAAKKLGWKLKVYKYDIAKGPQGLTAQMNNAMQSKPDYIGLTAVYPAETYRAPLQEAERRKIPVAAITGADDPQFLGCFSCAPAQEHVGRLAAAKALADAGEKTDVVIVADPTIIPLKQAADGAQKELEANGDGTKVDTLKISMLKPPGANASAVISYLQRHPDVRYGIFASTSTVTALAPQLKSTGLDKRFKVIGVSLNEADLSQVTSGTMAAGVAAENSFNAWRMLDAFVRDSGGEQLDAETRAPAGWARILTAESAAEPHAVEPEGFQDVFYRAWGLN